MSTMTSLLFISMPVLPFLIIYIVGATYAVVRWQSQPRRSRRAFLAFVLFFVRVVITMAKNWLMLRRTELGWDADTLVFNMGILGTVDLLMGIVAWVLLLRALFERSDDPVHVEPDSGARC
jgi:tryptophan-rich sensory protein